MKTNVSVVVNAEPMKLGEVMKPIQGRFASLMNLIVVENMPNCKLPRPSSSADVTHIHVGSVKKRRKSYLWFPKKHLRANFKPSKRHGADIVDVIVTDTSNPVYLALSSSRSILWVIHQAPDVTLDGISVIGGGPSALSADIDIKKIGFASKTSGQGSHKCEGYTIYPYRNKKERVARLRAQGKHDSIASLTVGYEIEEASYLKWQDWLQQRIGRNYHEIEDYQVEAVLVGAPPEWPIEPAPLRSKIYVAQTELPAQWIKD